VFQNLKRNFCVFTWIAVFAAAAGPFTARLLAQGATAAILGTVTDTTGAAIPEATVRVHNVGTGASQSTVTDAQGRFTVPDLAVGSYDVQAEKTGFATTVHKGITLTVGSQNVVDFAVPVGQQQQTITIQGEVSQVETTNASVGTSVTPQQMVQLPLNGRNFEQLIVLTPGVQQINAFTPSGFQGRAPEYSIAGSRPTGQAILLDDESLQNFWNKGMGSVTGSSLGVEAIGEFATLTNTYSAQFGGNGGVINAVSKSGTNGFHGSAYDFLRHSALDARNTFSAIKPPFRQNQFGGSLGGPIRKDRLFFFANYEGIRRALGETQIANVPACHLPGVCTPSATLSPASQQALAGLLALYPKPDPGTVPANCTPAAFNCIGRSVQNASQVAHENYALGRFDYNLSPKDAILGRYIIDKTDFVEPFGGGGFGGNQGIALWPESDRSEAHFSTLEWRRVVSPTVVNVARIHYSRTSTIAFTSGETPALNLFPGTGRQDATITVQGLSGLGGALQLPFNEVQNRFTEGDDVTWTRGSHNIRMGASVSRLETNTYMPFRQGSQWVFAGLPGLLSGAPLSLSYTPVVLPNGQSSYANRDFRDLEFTPYLEDDWRVLPKLTLNLGLRWEFLSNPVDHHNDLYAITNFATATQFTNVPHILSSNPNTRNFAPRVGFAFDPFADHKTSVRGGFGMFYSPFLPPDYAPAYWDQPPYPTYSAGIGVNIPATYPNIPAPLKTVLTSSPGFNYLNHNTPYVIQYNLNVERQIAENTVLTVGYVGSRGVHLLTEREDNPPSVTTDAAGVQHFGTISPAGAVVDNVRLNPNLGSFPDMIPTTLLRYNSLQTSFDRRFSRQFSAQVAYTFSRCIDDGAYGLGSFTANAPALWTNPYNQSPDKSRCSYDLTHVLSVNGLWAIPLHGNRIVEGWQLSGILRSSSGIPFTVNDGVDASGLSVTSVRPNVIPGCHQFVGSPSQWFNPNCFTLEPLTTLGNLGRDTETGPRLNNTDLALSKDTKIREQLRVQFRAEFFNIFNHPNYAVPGQQNTNASLFTAIANGHGVPNPNAGRITQIVGTPRQIQFGLKVVF
jgi:hypothetical protein